MNREASSRSLVIALISLTFTSVACRGQAQGVHSAEVLPTPVTGVVLTATANHHKCSTDGCLFTYRLRLTNPMNQDVNVHDCLIPGILRLPILGAPAGADVSANATIRLRSTAQLPIKKSEADGLQGEAVTCTALDWHGNPPI